MDGGGAFEGSFGTGRVNEDCPVNILIAWPAIYAQWCRDYSLFREECVRCVVCAKCPYTSVHYPHSKVSILNITLAFFSGQNQGVAVGMMGRAASC